MKTKLSALILAAGTSAHAAVVVQTGFETTDSPAYAVGTLPTTTSRPVYDVNNQGTRAIQDENTATPFGADNQYLAVGGANVRVRASGLTSLTTISFDFYEPSGTSGVTRFGFGNADLNGTDGYIGWNVNNGALTVGSNTALASGSIASLQQDRHYLAQMLLNRSGTGQNVDLPGGGSLSLGNNQAALYFFDTVTSSLVASGVFSHSAAVTPANFFFRGFSTETNVIYVDNFTRSNTLTVVPEPAAAMLGSLGFLFLFRRRK
ncbi:MAG: PEP-CTERM sorting domain-containing protein [Akkermansiaceae bacterium]|nr:PEP-CTERM sorting domain-containing protein [Akkermansiaceae bacterium]MCP5542622.1 PEP-CTERM sorting domain-containing protein [Akkermansiaceae bacterium]MCP5548265.1 PEP-CTERM sorting domain-containing protein [Akkermansiaceae bacterium]